MNIIRKITGAVIPVKIKQKLRELTNTLYSDETMEESKKKWKRLAKKNANYYVMTDYGENITEEQFSKTGKSDYETHIKNDAFFKKLAPLKSKTILEIGCGTGRITDFIAQDFKEVHGIDIAEEMIEQAKKRLTGKTNVHLTATDGLHVPYPDSFFDAAFSFIVFQHMPDRETIKKNIEEIVRVLKKGGLAKIQLRGIPVAKEAWFYGASFTPQQTMTMIEGLPVRLLKTEGVGLKYFWVWLEKI